MAKCPVASLQNSRCKDRMKCSSKWHFVKHPGRHSQCPARQQLSGLAGSQPPAGAAESFGLQSRKLGPKTAPWQLYGPGKNQLTCQAPPPAHLSRKRANNHQHTRTGAERKPDIAFRATWLHNQTAASGLCVGGTFNQHNGAHCANVTWNSACIICCNRVSVKMLGASKPLGNRNQVFDFLFQLISIISGITVQKETWLGGAMATKPLMILTVVHWTVQLQEKPFCFF